MNTATTPTPPQPSGPADHMPETFTVKDFESTFSPEEIAAMTTGDDPIALAAEPEPKKPDAGPTIDDQANAAAAQALQAQQAAQAAAEPQPDAGEDEGKMPVFEVPDTAKAEQTLAQIDQNLDAIQQKYDAGDLTAAEFRAEIAKAAKEQAAAQRVLDDAQAIITQAQEEANAKWLAQINTFKAQPGNDALFQGEHRAGFDAALKRVSGDPANHNLTFKTMINMAANSYSAEYKARTGQDLAVTTSGGQQQTQQKAEVLTTPRPEAPQLLGTLNGDSNMSVNDGTFSAIDRTADRDPLAAEAMLSKLTPEQYEAYLLGG